METTAHNEPPDYESQLSQLIELNRRRNAAYKQISDRLVNAENMESGVNSVLEYVGVFLGVSRAYIYERDPGTTDRISCTFEWCAPGISPVKETMRHIPFESLEYHAYFKESPIYCVSDTSNLEGPVGEWTHSHGIKAFLQNGIFDKGQYSGLIGVDDCNRSRPDWMKNIDEQNTISYVSNLLSMYLIKERNVMNLSRVQKILEVQQKDLYEQLAAVLGGVKGGLVICKNKPGYPYLYISESAAAMQGYTPAELMKVTKSLAVQNIHEDDRSEVEQTVYRELEKNGAHLIKYRMYHKDGNEIWVSVYAKIVSFTERKPLLYAFFQDITEQEVARQQLMYEQNIFRGAIMQNSVLNFVADVTEDSILDDFLLPDGKRHLSDLGYSVPAPLNKMNRWFLDTFKIQILTPGGEAYFDSAEIERMYRNNITTDSVELYLGTIDAYFRLRPLLSENPVNGHVMCFCSCYNITAEKQAQNMQEQALRNALSAAQQANRAKTIFLNNMSHDIRTPMNAILGYTGLAQKHVTDAEKTAGYLQKIEQSGTHLLSLINDVLDMSRIEAGKMTLNREKESLTEIIRETCTMIENEAAAKQLVFTSNTDAIRRSDILCDKLRVKQVLINCLNNAVKFTEPGGKVDLSVTQMEDTESGWGNYHLEIADTGIGMSDEFRQRIFQPFERAETSTVSGIQGTGLGMSICKSIVDNSGGTIAVESKEGVGTTIIIDIAFPYSEQEMADGQTQQKPDDQTAVEQNSTELQGVRILLAEDNMMNREIAVELLEEMGAAVTTVCNGRNAIQAIKDAHSDTYDLILMDIQMPEMDGYTATRCIRALPDKEKCSIPIIAMTANAFEEDRQMALEAGMNGHISKPVDVNILIPEIRRVL